MAQSPHCDTPSDLSRGSRDQITAAVTSESLLLAPSRPVGRVQLVDVTKEPVSSVDCANGLRVPGSRAVTRQPRSATNAGWLQIRFAWGDEASLPCSEFRRVTQRGRRGSGRNVGVMLAGPLFSCPLPGPPQKPEDGGKLRCTRRNGPVLSVFLRRTPAGHHLFSASPALILAAKQGAQAGSHKRESGWKNPALDGEDPDLAIILQ